MVHALVLLLIAGTGILQMRHSSADVTEVAFLDAGGGGGGGGQQLADATGTADAADTAVSDDILDFGKANRPVSSDVNKAVTDIPAVDKSYDSKLSGSGSGYGGGHGTGVGTGTGSGRGAGSGSGSGGGHGSGHGTGTGSGIGQGVLRNPAVPPRIARSVTPIYPAAQKEAGVEGVVYLRLVVGVDGTVESTSLIRTSGSPELDAAAAQAAAKWRFTAAKNKAGRRVRCYFDLPLRFKINYN